MLYHHKTKQTPWPLVCKWTIPQKLALNCVDKWRSLSQYSYITIYENYVRFDVFTAVTIKNVIFWDVMLCLVRTEVLEEFITPIFKVRRITKLGTMLAVTINCSMLRKWDESNWMECTSWWMGKIASCNGVSIVVFICYHRGIVKGCCIAVDVTELSCAGDLRFSQQWLWRMPSSGMLCCVTPATSGWQESPSSLIVVTLMMEVLSSSDTSVLTRVTCRNIPENAILLTNVGVYHNGIG
jgi:hypothetical protein